jgi:hypothetical protein
LDAACNAFGVLADAGPAVIIVIMITANAATNT